MLCIPHYHKDLTPVQEMELWKLYLSLGGLGSFLGLFIHRMYGGFTPVSEDNLKAVCIYARNQKGVLKEIAGTFADHNANIVMIRVSGDDTWPD